MPKFARPNSYTGKQSNKNWTGQVRAANSVEAGDGESEQLYISPATVEDAISSLLGISTGVNGLDIDTNLNLTSVATKISMNGGAATDFIGTATLTAGTVTVANTNIAAGDRIMISRSALNASPVLGHLIYTISPGASFTVASYDATGVAAVTDVSSFTYVIVRQT